MADSHSREDVLTVRAHHLVCLAHHAAYHGAHPTLPSLLRALREDPDRRLRVVAGPDDICLPCPYWDGVRCARETGMEEKNRVKDERFLDVLGLKDGEERSAREVYALVAARVTRDALKRICADCEFDACAEAARRFRIDEPEEQGA